MEGLLCSQEMDQIEAIYKEAFNLDSGLVFFPIRHHSPACAYHLEQVIQAYQPEIVLIEGPFDTNLIVKFIEHEESVAPLCIYYSYSDKKGLLGEKEEKYRCYYPFLDYSPELVALRQAKSLGIPATFIDLPYYEILRQSTQDSNLKNQTAKTSYNNDYFIERGKFLQKLCEKEGCRNFSELWEKLYEIDGIRLDSESFVKNMLAYCYLSRVDQTDDMLMSEGCIARENYMAAHIRETQKKYKKILVITGGFHTWGILNQLKSDEAIPLKDYDSQDVGVYPMAYSFEESDQLGGYGSGMPYPAFYQKVWEGIQAKAVAPFQLANMHFIVRCGNGLRKNGTALSIADEIEAYTMTKGLASLRDKPESGVYELLDSVRSAFVKGELNVYDKAPLEVLKKLLTGRKIGKLCGDAEVPPLVRDFREKALKMKLKTHTTIEQEIILDIYKNPRHREISKLLHTLNFLGTSFCKMIKGPDYVNRRNTNLVRETWRYKWSTGVESSLIEVSVYGGSLEEAAGEMLKKRLKDIGTHAGQVSLLMIDALMMGSSNPYEELLDLISEMIVRDGQFYSVSECLYHLAFLNHAAKLLGVAQDERLGQLVTAAYSQSVLLIKGITNASQDEENTIISRLKDMYSISLNREYTLDVDAFVEALLDIANKNECNSGIQGASIGLLMGLDRIDKSFAVQCARGYLFGTGDKFIHSAGFLKGLFATGRDIVFYDDLFIKGIDHVIKNIQEEDFMRILPELRYAFSFFTPNEIDTLGKSVSDTYQVHKHEVVREEILNPETIRLGTLMNDAGLEILRKWGLFHA